MDWIQFLDANRIDYVTSGPNTRKGQISIKCPWCSEDDPSEHLSISLTKDAYGCWRNVKHAGRKPYSLVAILMGCSFTQAKTVVQQFSVPDPTTLDDVVNAFENHTGASAIAAKPPEGLPPEFRQIKPTGLTSRFWRYLTARGFDDVPLLHRKYGLMCCQSGRWKDRVIIPLHQDRALLGWTARAIQPTVNAPRYLSSSPEIKNTVMLEDELSKGGKMLCVTEGPFDAMKVDFYGAKLGLRATCLFGVNPTISQISIIRAMARSFDSVKILFDAAAFEMALMLSDSLSLPNLTIANLPEGVKDPGALNAKQIRQMAALF
jgi:hypothetical protein